jgi:hypothetical protein
MKSQIINVWWVQGWVRSRARIRFVWLAMALGAIAAAVPAEELRFHPVDTADFSAPAGLSNAWADFDQDGRPDLAVSFEGGEIRLYRNLDGSFTNVAAQVGIKQDAGDPRSLAWGDYDADGDLDLYVGYSGYDGPPNQLYRNDLDRGQPAFTEVGAATGTAVRGVIRQSSFVNYDADGDLDLYVALRDDANLLLENSGGHFHDVAYERGLFEPRRTVGACWFDMDSDGDLDLFTANQNGDRDGMFRNEAGLFRDVAAELDMDQPRRSVEDGSVGCAVTDFDNDGDLDLFVAAYGPDRLHRNNGNGSFTDVAAAMGVAVRDHMVAAAWGDMQNDGRPDLYVVGFVWGEPGRVDYLFGNLGERFENLLPQNIRGNDGDHGVQWVDFDGDGDLDLSLTHSDPSGQHPLYRNDLKPDVAARSIQVLVLDGEGKYLLPGAEVRVYRAGSKQLLGLRLVDTGGGYNAQSALPVHIGLADLSPVDIEVRFASSQAWLRGVDPAARPGQPVEVRLAVVRPEHP